MILDDKIWGWGKHYNSSETLSEFLIRKKEKEDFIKYNFDNFLKSQNYPKPTLPPNLALEIEFIEPSGNRYLDAEESGEINLRIINNGQGEAYGLETTIVLQNQVKGLLIDQILLKKNHIIGDFNSNLMDKMISNSIMLLKFCQDDLLSINLVD